MTCQNLIINWVSVGLPNIGALVCPAMTRNLAASGAMSLRYSLQLMISLTIVACKMAFSLLRTASQALFVA